MNPDDIDNMSVILCTAGYDHTIRFWEALSGICSRTIQHPESQVNRLCITPDKKFLAAAGRHVVRLYDIKSSNPNAIMTFEGHTSNVTGIGFHCEGKWMVTSSEDGSVKVWDTRTGAIQRMYNHDYPVNDVAIHPNQGELVSADRGGWIYVYDLGEDKATHRLCPEDDVPVSSVSIASDGTLMVAGNNKGDVYVWRMYQQGDETALKPIRVFNAHKTYLTRLLLSPDIKLLATCSADHTVRIWRIDMNEQNLEIMPEGFEDEESESELPNNTEPPTPTTATLTSRPALPRHESSSSLSSATSSEHSHSTNSLSTSRRSLTSAPSPTTHHSPASSIVTNPEANFTHTRIKILRRRSPLPLETILENHQRWVWDCAFSADSAYLVTVCSDHYARLWEVASATIIRQYNGHHRGAVCVALNDYSNPP